MFVSTQAMRDGSFVSASGGNYEPHDLLALRTRLPDAATMIVNLFHMHTPDVLTMLYVATYYDDKPLLERELVRLRGSSGAVGGTYVVHLCGAAESLVESGQMHLVAALIPRIEEAVDELLAALPLRTEGEPLRLDAG